MLEIIDTNKLKKKFGELLSKLYTDNNLSCTEIEEIIINSEYFDFLERGNPKEFLDDSYENIAKKVFHSDSVFSRDILSEFYWAGEMYMSIALNCMLPLRQVILLCPIVKMLAYFNVYHEMSENELIKQFNEVDYHTSILRLLRKRNKLTIRELSSLSGICINTLKDYENNNEKLFKASFENVTKLSNVLNCSKTYFMRYTMFVPFTYLYFEDKELFLNLTNKLNAYYRKDNLKYSFNGTLVEISGKSKKRYVSETVLISLIRDLLIECSKKEIMLF